MRKLTEKFPNMIGTLVIVLFVSLGIFNIVSTHHRLKSREVQLQTTSVKMKKLESKYETLNSNLDKAKADKQTTQQQLDSMQKQKEDLEKQKADLESQLQARADAKAAEQARIQRLASAAKLSTKTATVAAATIKTVPQVKSSAVSGCGDNFYANYIYSHESGCKTHNPNSSGCDGIGQACPASKVIGSCGYDYACQNAWFTNYASKYGGWQGAYNFWISHHWW